MSSSINAPSAPEPDNNSFGARLFVKMAQFRQASNGTISRAQWVALANQEFAIAARSTKNKSDKNLPDEEWVKQLEAKECYHGIDIRREIGKCQMWASTARRVASRKRIINWLNKVERPISYSGTGKTSRTPSESNPYKEPQWNWRKTALALFPAWGESPYSASPWCEVPMDYRKQILRRGPIEPGQGEF